MREDASKDGRLDAAAVAGSEPLTHYETGLRYEFGVGVVCDLERAVDCYEQASALGMSLASYRLGRCLELGLGVHRDLSRASRCYDEVASHGLAVGQVARGRMLFEGHAGKRDFMEARKLFRLADQQGNPEGSYWLSVCQFYGIGGPAESDAAHESLLRGAKGGQVDAQAMLGRCLFAGAWGQVDLVDAFRWLSLAARKGHVESGYLLGLCYLNGYGVTAEEARAVSWLNHAASKGHREAQLLLTQLGYPVNCCYEAGQQSVADLFSELADLRCMRYNADSVKDKGVNVAPETLRDNGRNLPDNHVNDMTQAGALAPDKRPTVEVPKTQAKKSEPPLKEVKSQASPQSADKKPSVTVKSGAEAQAGLFAQGMKAKRKGNLKAALEAFEAGCKNGDSACICALGECYEDGEGCERDDARASSLFSQAAELGNPRAKILVGRYEYSIPDEDSLVSEHDHFSVEGLGMKMLWCPRGVFQMGSPKGWFGGATERGRSDNEQRHQVTLTTGFWLGRFPLTQEHYEMMAKRFGLATNPSQFKGEQLPVENVSWSDAQLWCQGLTEHEQAAGRLPDHYVYRLPTEAEWEYACRAGSTAAFYDGRNLVREDGICESLQALGWFRDNSNELTHEVGLLAPNRWGFYDMHGNVSEWCYDKVEDYGSGACTDPLMGFSGKGSDSGLRRIRRGGSWQDTAKDCRCASRSQGSVSFRRPFIGFRVALGVELPSWRH